MVNDVAGAICCSIFRSYEDSVGVRIAESTVEGEISGVLLVGFATVVLLYE